MDDYAGLRRLMLAQLSGHALRPFRNRLQALLEVGAPLGRSDAEIVQPPDNSKQVTVRFTVKGF